MNFNCAIWVIFYFIFTLLLYFCSIKEEWNNLRISHGLVKHGSIRRPKFYDKNEFTNKTYFWYCGKVFFACTFLSALIMILTFLILPSTKFNTEIEFFRTILFLVIIYSLFIGIANEIELNSSDKVGIIKSVFKIFNSLKILLLQPIINDEYEDIKEMINNTLKEWERKRTPKNDKIGSVILRFHKFIENNRKDSVEESILDRVNDLLYDLYDTYIQDEDEFIMDDINNLIDKIILDKLGINIIDLALFINHQPNKVLTKEKIKRKMQQMLDTPQVNIQEQSTPEISANDLINQV